MNVTMTDTRATKPIGRKAYGSIGHLLSSRLGPGDFHVHEGQDRICTTKARDKHDRIVVQEKLDGSCMAVAMTEDRTIVALGRKGYPASSSPFEMHHLFDRWVEFNKARFFDVLEPGERIVGEWLAQAHGTTYVNVSEPFVAFDIMRGTERLTTEAFYERVKDTVAAVNVLEEGPISPIDAFAACHLFGREAQEGPEGVVYRVERKGKVDFLAKWVRPDKIDGCYLPGCGDNPPDAEPVWLWRPVEHSSHDDG